jgi:hypothetical protein
MQNGGWNKAVLCVQDFQCAQDSHSFRSSDTNIESKVVVHINYKIEVRMEEEKVACREE